MISFLFVFRENNGTHISNKRIYGRKHVIVGIFPNKAIEAVYFISIGLFAIGNNTFFSYLFAKKLRKLVNDYLAVKNKSITKLFYFFNVPHSEYFPACFV